MKHIMLDLETMGTRFDAPVIAIGACYFDPDTGDIGETFYRSIDMEDACRFGKVSGGTIKWWLQQDARARADVIKGEVTLDEALSAFVEFYAKGGGKTPVWGNGPTFDCSILDYAFQRRLQIEAPWPYWAVRDCRTIKNIATTNTSFAQKVTQGGTAHNALDDAVFQAKWVSEMWQWLRAGKPAPSGAGEDLAALSELLG